MTDTVTDFCATPVSFEQLNVYVVVSCKLAIVSVKVPLAVLAPDQPPDARQLSAFSEVQVRVIDSPWFIVV